MIQRIALFLGCVAAAAVVTVALAPAGMAPARPAPSAANLTGPSTSTAYEPPLALAGMASAAPTVTTQVDTVYVQPAATPRVVRVVRHAPRPTPPPVIVRRVVRAVGGEREGGEGDGGESD